MIHQLLAALLLAISFAPPAAAATNPQPDALPKPDRVVEYEWRNLAKDSAYASIKAELAKSLPQSDAPWPAGTEPIEKKEK